MSRDLLTVLHDFHKVQDNWDSYGARRPYMLAINKAQHFIRAYLRDEDWAKATATVTPEGHVALMFMDVEGNEYNLVFDDKGYLDVREYVLEGGLNE